MPLLDWDTDASEVFFNRARFLKKNEGKQSSELANIQDQQATLTPVFSKDFFQKTSPDIDSGAFETKFKLAAEGGPLLFLRSFVTTFYTDLKDIKGAGPIGTSFGDAHLENFGFVIFADGPHYVYNDFDDAGPCPIGLDILRYLTSVRLYEKDNPKEAERLARRYIQIVYGEEKAESLDEAFHFDSKKKKKKNLERYTSKGLFLASPELSRAMPSDLGKIKAMFLNSTPLNSFKVHDVAISGKEVGGSAGLDRLWILVDGTIAGDSDILECKQLIAPGTAAGNWGEIPKARLEWLTRELWPSFKPVDHVETVLNNVPFLLRSRTKGSLELADFSEKDREKLYKTQIGIVATHHLKIWDNWEVKKKVSAEAMEEWLNANSEFLAERYSVAAKNALTEK